MGQRVRNGFQFGWGVRPMGRPCICCNNNIDSIVTCHSLTWQRDVSKRRPIVIDNKISFGELANVTCTDYVGNYRWQFLTSYFDGDGKFVLNQPIYATIAESGYTYILTHAYPPSTFIGLDSYNRPDNSQIIYLPFDHDRRNRGVPQEDTEIVFRLYKIDQKGEVIWERELGAYADKIWLTNYFGLANNGRLNMRMPLRNRKIIVKDGYIYVSHPLLKNFSMMTKLNEDGQIVGTLDRLAFYSNTSTELSYDIEPFGVSSFDFLPSGEIIASSFRLSNLQYYFNPMTSIAPFHLFTIDPENMATTLHQNYIILGNFLPTQPTSITTLVPAAFLHATQSNAVTIAVDGYRDTVNNLHWLYNKGTTKLFTNENIDYTYSIPNVVRVAEGQNLPATIDDWDSPPHLITSTPRITKWDYISSLSTHPVAGSVYVNNTLISTHGEQGSENSFRGYHYGYNAFNPGPVNDFNIGTVKGFASQVFSNLQAKGVFSTPSFFSDGPQGYIEHDAYIGDAFPYSSGFYGLSPLADVFAPIPEIDFDQFFGTDRDQMVYTIDSDTFKISKAHSPFITQGFIIPINADSFRLSVRRGGTKFYQVQSGYTLGPYNPSFTDELPNDATKEDILDALYTLRFNESGSGELYYPGDGEYIFDFGELSITEFEDVEVRSGNNITQTKVFVIAVIPPFKRALAINTTYINPNTNYIVNPYIENNLTINSMTIYRSQAKRHKKLSIPASLNKKINHYLNITQEVDHDVV